jgi:putative membrane protein
MPGMNHQDGMMSWWMSGWGWFWVLLATAVLVAALIWVAAKLSSRRTTSLDRTPGDALRILEERFARGEIDQAEFDQRRAALRDDGP